MAWSSALAQYARTKDLNTLPEGTLLRSDEHTLTIYDGYPKAKFHFLVLPRVPFQLQSSDSEGSEPKDAFELLKKGPACVPPNHLSNLKSLLSSPHASRVLAALRKASEETVQLIKEEQPYTKLTEDQVEAGTTWPVHVGFHAVPSMEHVHLHIISSDLISERLKNKKHYLSFHPSHGFWLPLTRIEEMVRKGQKKLPHDERYYENLLKSTLTSFYDESEHSHIPKLKAHLETKWIEDVRRRRASGEDDGGSSMELKPSEAPRRPEGAEQRHVSHINTSARRSASPAAKSLR
ncbi:hypothetical protein IE81DRAFT_187534 [Ceraceosorus guamensis]|uniref:Aprataxin C2HE/C2H2/C2HC zinc finger domain-containing protein n=1 Tax=Ceraceosorus guamensis TaxID=1522189 RepID=A0A316VXR9_9BASI|nr:hypothetical protein IE81DRAFT_187534 [Ceraceosorus guamensis]PWN41091.1 hypothetical protein IE81DRAFT_187534 [Ceraceosorus guamensis]